MANYIQIRAKKASDVIGAGVISYALIGSFLLYKFHINLMEYITPIILGFVVITVSFACTKRFFYHIMMENSNLLLLGVQKEYISSTSTTNEPQKVEDEAQNSSPDTKYDTQSEDNDTQNDSQNDSQSDTQNIPVAEEIDEEKKHGYSYIDKYEVLQREMEEQNTKRKLLIMEAIREYVTYTVAPYLKKEDVLILLENINCMAIGHTSSYKSIRSDLNNPLRSPDLRHLAWNIGERLGISNRERAIFIKASFPFELRDATVEYLEKNLRDVIPASIPIDRPAKGDYKFNSMKKTIAA